MVPYVLLLWSIIAYKILLSIGVTDNLYLVQNTVVGVLTLRWDNDAKECYKRSYDGEPFTTEKCLFFRVGEFFACLRAGYLQAVPYLFLVLAINRFAAIVGHRKNRWLKVFCMVSIIIAWVIAVPLMLTLNYIQTTTEVTDTNHDIHFRFFNNGYNYNGPILFRKAMAYFGPILLGISFVVTVLVVCVIGTQKHMYGANFRISTVEIRLIIQGLLILFPLSLIEVQGFVFAIGSNAWLFVFWHIFGSLLPVINLSLCIIFNPAARMHLSAIARTLKRKNNTTVVRLTGLTQKTSFTTKDKL
ncbi:hypothetical protein L596_029315 [Steinernema carpocapsae]|uniref:G-protein coupled receptors family 1 profile domain-containing protein n=1 Tax=Steinernema carpocapsae TaxID=34508 RepID=A0A4U5LU98_STECR|nr:hypothetical protein L596_029315 [Steinernema carpocapsae]